MALAVVRHSTNAYNATDTNAPKIIFGGAPANGNLLIAVIMKVGVGSPTAGTGWTHVATSSGAQSISLLYKYAGAGESTTQTPITGTFTQWSVSMWEISGVTGTIGNDLITQTLASLATGFPGTTDNSVGSFTTGTANQLLLIHAGGNSTASGVTYTVSAGPGSLVVDDTWPGTAGDGAGTFEVAVGAHETVPGSGTFVEYHIVSSAGANMSFGIVQLQQPASTETSTATMTFSGIAFSAAIARTETTTSVMAFAGINYTAAGATGHTATGLLTFSGITIVASAIDLGAAGTGAVHFATFGA